jgi:hypothetical protein
MPSLTSAARRPGGTVALGTFLGWSALACSGTSPTPSGSGAASAPEAGTLAVRVCDGGPGAGGGAACAPQPDAAASLDARAEGQVESAAGSDGRSCLPSGAETCDGKDNDCNGVIDDGFTWQSTPVGRACFSDGYGACITMGVVVCTSPSSAGCSSAPVAPDQSFHVSGAPNGSWDWNCNNGVDRKYPLAACESFTAATCPAQGWAPEPGQAGDCGESLVQHACSATATGCQSTGSAQTVVEACK